MKASTLFAESKIDISLASDFEVKDICIDHRKVSNGSIFVAIKGSQNDGHQWISAAIQAGAKLIVHEVDAKEASDASFVRVPNARKALSQLASVFFGRPAESLRCIGITGTNGKTSISLMLEKILNDADQLTGVMGTIDHHCGDKKWSSQLTTPDAVTLHQRFKDFLDFGAQAVALEVSSHALDQGRVDSIDFDVAIFTNLTRDHLDYHESMEAYFAAKAHLFEKLLSTKKKIGVAVLNLDDPWAQKLHIQAPLKTIGISSQSLEADFYFSILKQDYSGTEFELKFNKQIFSSSLRLIGVHTVYNAISSLAAAYVLGVPVHAALKSLQEFTDIPGRLQPVGKGNIHVFVDYAHTDDALASSLKALLQIRKSNKSYNESKLHLVFGCGGDRDKGKRPIMGGVAEKYADCIYVTSDNPRTEDPEQILKDILAGITKTQSKSVFSMVDRREAIAKALNNAKKDDVVLIAGKGHEDYQIIGKQKNHFSDAEEALRILNEL